jgi:hypothetical protein
MARKPGKTKRLKENLCSLTLLCLVLLKEARLAKVLAYYFYTFW